jgi:TBC1 domain family member 15
MPLPILQGKQVAQATAANMTQKTGKAPAKPPPSPTASFYDVSDEDEQDYSTISHTSSSKGVKLLFSKSKVCSVQHLSNVPSTHITPQVYVHPTPSAKDNIPGFIALVQQKSAPLSSEPSAGSTNATKQNPASQYLLAWVPESTLAGDDLSTYVKVDMVDSASPPKTTYFVPPLPVSSTYDDSNVGPYAFSMPLSSIYSILVRPPSLGWWFGSVVINTKSGSSLPALFFHDCECESTILQKKKRHRESFDPFGEHGGLFWGGDEVIRWLKRYVDVERSAADPSVYLVDPTEEDKIGFGSPRKSVESGRGQSKERRKSQQIEKKPAQGMQMDPLTKALKETRWKLLEQMSKITTFARRTAQDVANNDRVPPQVRRLLQNPEVQTIQDEFDSARLYLARWAMGIAEQSDKERSQRIWTAKDVLEMEESSVGEFEILDMEAGRMSLGGDSKRKPVTMKEWKSYFDSKGKITVTVDEVKERIFHGGLDPEDGARKEAWLFLLGVYDWQSTSEERSAYMNSKRDEYIRLKGAWWDRMIDGDATQEEEEWWKEQKGRIGKITTRMPLYARGTYPR